MKKLSNIWNPVSNLITLENFQNMMGKDVDSKSVMEYIKEKENRPQSLSELVMGFEDYIRTTLNEKR